MVGMLREEVGALESRLEDERFAAASARQSFAAREQELEVSGFQNPTFSGRSYIASSPGKGIKLVGLLFQAVLQAIGAFGRNWKVGKRRAVAAFCTKKRYRGPLR